MKYYSPLFVFFLSIGTVSAQNVVIPYEQEKIQITEEGQILHVFREGLALPGGMSNGNPVFNAPNIIQYLYATGQFVTPKAGERLAVTVPDEQRENRPVRPGSAPEQTRVEPWKWTPVGADEKFSFAKPESVMRSAYLYTAYDAAKEQIVLLETSGGTQTSINGVLHEGDHYDFGYTLTPVRLNKGLNEFVYSPGRFGRVTSKLVIPRQPILFTKRDGTFPDILPGFETPQWGAVRVINTTDETLKSLSIRATLPGDIAVQYQAGHIIPMTSRKLKFQIPQLPAETKPCENLDLKLELLDQTGKVLDQMTFSLKVCSPSDHHTRTFVSRIDGSVQFFSVRPAKREKPADTKALTLTLHGAAVDARNQTGCYSQKDWMDVVAATNRRPFGFNWEYWGRIDALEVLEEAKRIYQPDLSKIYLTGHSMGGHGTWSVGATHPDLFAAIAPCAGYPDRDSYASRRGGSANGNTLQERYPCYEAFARAGSSGRTLNLLENLKPLGVYVFHGEFDTVVPTAIARGMREQLAKFHTDFCYYEFPKGEHWFGNECMDWYPIFEFFARHTIPAAKNVEQIDFCTVSPKVSASNYWVRIEQQIKSYEMSRVAARQNQKGNSITITDAKNIGVLVLDIPSLAFSSPNVTVQIGSETLTLPANQKAILSLADGKWTTAAGINVKHKYSGRDGGFKEAFDNNAVFVYPTNGSPEENEGYRDKARFDAETFYYRGNGSFDIIPDTDYSVDAYRDRNVVIYGNKKNNKAWDILLSDSPIQVTDQNVTDGKHTWSGDDLGIYFIYPHPQSDTALVGAVAGTGIKGMKAAMPNGYISGVTGFPDFTVFRTESLRTGVNGVVAAGFFDSDWTLTRDDVYYAK